MTLFEEELRSLLRDFSGAVESHRSADASKKMPLQPLLEKLDSVTAAMPADIHPELRHYLERKSYEKARHFLDALEKS